MSSSFRDDLVGAIPMLRGFARSLSGNRDRAAGKREREQQPAARLKGRDRPGDRHGSVPQLPV